MVAAPEEAMFALESTAIKWSSLAALVVQNSSLFVVTRSTRMRSSDGDLMYLSSVVVLVVEMCKMAICLAVLWLQGSCFVSLRQHIWVERREAFKLAVPASCYALQNNLVFLAISNLSAAAAQVLYQTKTLSTAFFTVVLLGRTFKKVQWASFALLSIGVVLVQSQVLYDALQETSPNIFVPLLIVHYLPPRAHAGCKVHNYTNGRVACAWGDIGPFGCRPLWLCRRVS